MCLYMSSSMFTFGNIITATDGEPVASVAEVRRSARASHSLAYHGAMHVSSVPACKLSTAAGKKKRGRRPSGRFTVPQWGLTGRRRIRIGQTKLCQKFIALVFSIFSICFYIMKESLYIKFWFIC